MVSEDYCRKEFYSMHDTVNQWNRGNFLELVADHDKIA